MVTNGFKYKSWHKITLMLVARKFFYAHEKTFFIVVRKCFYSCEKLFYSWEKNFYIKVSQRSAYVCEKNFF